jgi:Protein of unknown function (DUF3592)
MSNGVLGSGLIVIGAALCIVGVLIHLGTRRKYARMARFSGRVTEITRKSTSISAAPTRHRHFIYAPVVAFTTPDGRPVTFTGSVFTGNKARYAEGDIIEVLYDAEGRTPPLIAKEKTHLASSALVAFGVVGCAIGYFLRTL